MNNTSIVKTISLSDRLTLSTDELMLALSCGRAAAVEIGTMAKSRINIGRKVLWNVEKIKKYLYSVSE